MKKHTAKTIAAIIAANLESDLPDRVIEALRPYDGKNITTRILDALPPLPNGATWRLIRNYGWTCLQTSTYCTPQGYADKTSMDLILTRTEASVPLDLAYVAGENKEKNSYGENCAYFSARRERNAARHQAMSDPEMLKKSATALNKYTAAIDALAAARAELDEITEYGTPMHPEQYTLRGIADPHDKAAHTDKNKR